MRVTDRVVRESEWDKRWPIFRSAKHHTEDQPTHKLAKGILSYVDDLTKIRPNVNHTTDVSTAYL